MTDQVAPLTPVPEGPAMRDQEDPCPQPQAVRPILAQVGPCTVDPEVRRTMDRAVQHTRDPVEPVMPDQEVSVMQVPAAPVRTAQRSVERQSVLELRRRPLVEKEVRRESLAPDPRH